MLSRYRVLQNVSVPSLDVQSQSLEIKRTLGSNALDVTVLNLNSHQLTTV